MVLVSSFYKPFLSGKLFVVGTKQKIIWTQCTSTSAEVCESQVKVNRFSQISTYHLFLCETHLNKVLFYIRHKCTDTHTVIRQALLSCPLLLASVMTPLTNQGTFWNKHPLSGRKCTPAPSSMVCVCTCESVNLYGPAGQFSFIDLRKLHPLLLRNQSSTPSTCGTR